MEICCDSQGLGCVTPTRLRDVFDKCCQYVCCAYFSLNPENLQVRVSHFFAPCVHLRRVILRGFLPDAAEYSPDCTAGLATLRVQESKLIVAY